MIITKRALSRRTMLRGLGVAVALPMLDAMVPALTAVANTAAKPETQEQTVVAVTADGRLHLNSKEVADADLTQRVTEVLETKKEKIVLIRADEDASYGRVMAAMDALRKAQIEDMGLITEKRTKAGETGGN